MKDRGMSFVLFLALLVPVSVRAQADVPDSGANLEALHNELRSFKADLVEAVDAQDVDQMISLLTEDIVVTWQNSEVVRGHQGVREFFERAQSASERTFLGYTVPPTPDDLTILYDNRTGISFGSNTGQYMVAGKQFEMTNRWTATVVKQGGRWLLASYHVSSNLLDNPVLNATKTVMLWGIGIAFVAGLALALIGIRLFPRKGTRATPSS